MCVGHGMAAFTNSVRCYSRITKKSHIIVDFKSIFSSQSGPSPHQPDKRPSSGLLFVIAFLALTPTKIAQCVKCATLQILRDRSCIDKFDIRVRPTEDIVLLNYDLYPE